MAGNIKGITIEFQGDTTRLDKALRKVKTESKSVDQQLKEVNRALRFNPRNAELLGQKFTLLKTKINSTENELKQFRMIEAQLKAQNVSKQSAEWMRVRREIIQAESRLKHYNAELRKVKYANITAMGNAFKTAGSNMRSAGMYATIGAGVMIASGRKLLQLNATQQQAETKLTEIYKTRMGVNSDVAKSTMELASALQKQGVVGDEITLSGAQQLATYAKMPSTINTLLPAMNNLLVQQKGVNATAEDATSIANLFGKAMMGQTGALKRVGISFTEAQEQVLKYGTEEEKAAMLAQVITDNVGNMNKVFAETNEGKLAQLRNTMGDIGERLGAILLPALAKAATWISENVVPAVERIVSFIEAHPIISKVAVGIAGLLAVMGPLLIFIGALIGAVGTIATAFTAMAAAETIALGPIVAVIAAIAALIAIGILLYKNWDTIKKKAIQVWTAIKAAINRLVTAIKTAVITNFNTLKSRAISVFNSLKSTVSSIWNGIKNAITKPIQTAKETVKKAIEKLKGFFPLHIGKIFSGLKVPHFKIKGGKAPFGIGGKGSKPSISVDWYAKGGIFRSPSIIGLGEAGPEAVVPLDTLWKKLDAIANASAAGAIVVNVYGSDNMSVNDLAAAVEKKLIQAQKRRSQAWA